MYGRRLPVQYSEQVATGRVILVEVAPGEAVRLPAWMTDASICVRMELGAPRVSVKALQELHRLLLEQGFRRSSPGDSHIVQEEQHGPSQKSIVEEPTAGRDAAADQHRTRVEMASGIESAGAHEVTHLANLLMQAAGLVTEERNDELR